MSRRRPLAISVLTTLGILPAIAVTSQTAPPPYHVAFVATHQGKTGIHVMRADGSNIRLVAEVEKGGILEADSWSPTGDKIAYFGDEKELGQGRYAFHFPLYVVNVDGTNRQRLLDMPVCDFAWSPDSTRLAFVSGFEDPNFVPPSPSSDGVPDLALYVVTLDGRRVTRLTPFQSRVPRPSWSSDGRLLAFASGEVYVIEPSGANPRQLTKTGAKADWSAWSPRGDWIAFATGERDERGRYKGGLFVIRPDGSGLKQLLGEEEPRPVLGWSPDGASLAVLGPDPLLIDVEKGTSIRFRLNPQAVDPRFAPDGRSIVFRVRDGRVRAFDLQDQTERELIRLVGGWSFTLSPLLRTPSK